MKKKIIDLLTRNQRLKGREIARLLKLEKKAVNRFLHDNRDVFIQDDEYFWSYPCDNEIVVHFEDRNWIDCHSFEKSLKTAGCVLRSNCKTVIFKTSNNKGILLEASARLLALTNQLVSVGKDVTIDFSDSKSTLHYFNRMGFFDHLNLKVDVLPSRPVISTANRYKGKSDNLVEMGEIDPENPNNSLPKQLKNCFVDHAGEKYSDAAFTVFSELFGNVCEHSETKIPGFAALQKYGKSNSHVQTVVSDSGIGIIGSIKPVLGEYYPKLFKKYDFDNPVSDVKLTKEILETGQITKTGFPSETGRGLGLKRSQEIAVRYNANISVRQESFELILKYRNGVLNEWYYNINMPLIYGTHVCFDFYLD